MKDLWIDRLRPILEEDGWEIRIGGWVSFEKGNVVGILIEIDRIMITVKDVLLDKITEQSSNGRLFLGYCKNGEDFRTICKLLGI